MTALDRRRFLQLGIAAAFATRARATTRLRVVVAGAGIIGASAAWHLAKAGADVTVIDRDGPATHASRGTFAWINATWSKQPRAYHALNQAGVAGWRGLQAELKLPVRWGGSLEGIDDAAIAATLADRVAEQVAWGEATRIVAGAELAALEPNVSFSGLQRVVLSGHDGAADPVAATRAFLDAATALGARVSYPCELTGVALTGGRLSTVQTNRGDIAADAGRRFADFDVPQRDTPGSTALSVPMPRVVNRVLWMPGVHVHQRDDGRLVIGEEAGPPPNEAHAARLAAHPNGFPTREIALEHGERMRASVQRFVPELDQVEFEDVRICWRPMPIDGYPVVGASPARPDVYLAVTHSGVTLAPILGQHIAHEIVDGARVDALQDFRPDRKFVATTGH